MLKKIKLWWGNRKAVTEAKADTYTYTQLENAYRLGYTDGRRDGLSIAREQASKSLKEILWQQNQPNQKK